MTKSLFELVAGASRWHEINDEVHSRIAAGESTAGTDADGDRFLHIIARKYVHAQYAANFEEAMRCALAQSCGFTAQNKTGCTPVHYAANKWRTLFLDLAIQHAGTGRRGAKYAGQARQHAIALFLRPQSKLFFGGNGHDRNSYSSKNH